MSLHKHLSARLWAPRSTLAHAFVLASASAHPNLQARLEFHDAPHRPLWRVEVQSELEKYTPLLFAIEPGSAFDAWLGSVIDALPITILFSRLSFDALWRHLRRLSKFEDDHGHYFLRLGDPASLHLYTASLAHTPEQVAHLFDQGSIGELFFHDPHIELSRSVQPLFEQGLDNADRDGCLLWRNVARLGDT
ncbi:MULTISPECIES: DUF4123 domain-containing protein [Burkholderia]|uniref:DUF4123 domain-containing protein n=1 Tax=Burkholderia aenigmatica TaxID=2015348 RepID=A0ABY6XWE4_9BURK|nr:MULTISPECIES: DUF4123 domain-containing protein [Burkholderia]VWC94352.1 hypothetical protein BLA17378_04796 [Burkholderia aenigmatica]VWD29485.1 hypothetical protein BLA18628_04499 [Burkholderia aenigmatica]